MNRTSMLSTLIVVLLILSSSLSHGQGYNGFDLKDSSIPKRQIHNGGPGKDGIPSIDRPRFTVARLADFLKDDDRVLGVSSNGFTKAYPIKILDRHEIVNDRFGNRKVVITYCPLCGSGIAFDADINGPKDFGVSGLLYNSDVLLYDRQTESLWSQIAMKAIAGPLKGTELKPIPTRFTTWEKWKEEFPSSLVLSNKQGMAPPSAYERKAYPGYEKSNRLLFPVSNQNKTLQRKARVIGLRIGDAARAYPFDALKKHTSAIKDTISGRTIEVRFDAESNTATIYDESGAELPGFSMYWFAWYTFNPDTEIFSFQSDR